MEVRDAVERAKKLHRPRLRDWSREGFATRRFWDFEALRSVDKNFQSPRRVQTIGDDLTEPVIVEGLTEKWRKWESVDAFFRDSASFSDLRLKCGEDDDGNNVKLTLGEFKEYVRQNSFGDDSPLYIFDSGTFGESRKPGAQMLRAAYDDVFADAHGFSLVGEKRRPPYRWFLMGPKRSGTCVHVDPLGTAAWNALLVGSKRWVLFEPGTSREVVKGTTLYKGDDEPINYFADILPQIRQTFPHARRFEFLQKPGETVVVPPGWWHAVINLEDTIAITHNFVHSFDSAYLKARSSRPTMTRVWFRKLPADLAKRAKRLGAGGANPKLQALLSSSKDDIVSSSKGEKKRRLLAEHSEAAVVSSSSPGGSSSSSSSESDQKKKRRKKK